MSDERPNPFPGMDPYLESCWGDIHASVVVYARDQLARQLPGDLRARVEEYVFVRGLTEDVKPSRLQPDVHVRQHTRGRNSPTRALAGVAVAEGVEAARRRDTETFTQQYVRVIDAAAGGRLVTVLEVLSRANKADPVGRRSYRLKTDAVLNSGTNLVEIDLLRGGQFMLAADLDGLPPAEGTAYTACVSRATTPETSRLFRMPLRERLPAIPVPLRETDADAVLDLQALIDLVYANGGYDDTDYRADADPPLEGADAAWADELLRGRGLRP